MLPGSFMSGQTRWAVNGGIAFLVGAALLVGTCADDQVQTVAERRVRSGENGAFQCEQTRLRLEAARKAGQLPVWHR